MPALYTSQVFPGGQEKTLVITATAGNVATTLSPGIGLRWRILRGSITCVNDATVAARYGRMSVTDGTDILTSKNGQARAATTTWGIELTDIVQDYGTLSPRSAYDVARSEIIITGLDEFRISVDGGVAGDSYSGKFAVLEMAVN